MRGITRPSAIDHDRWYVQKVGRYFLLYDGETGDYVTEFPAWKHLVAYIDSENKKR